MTDNAEDVEPEDAHTIVHNAIGALLDDSEIAVSWVLVLDVAGPEDMRYLGHYNGGGHDGLNAPMPWTILGMLQAGVGIAREILSDSTFESFDDADDVDEDDDE